MNCQRSAQRIAVAFCSLLATGAVVATEPAALQSREHFETAPVLNGALLAPAALLKGPLHAVAELVMLDGYFGRFVIESKFGNFSVVGANMLGVRVNEMQAIAALHEIEGSQAFQDSLMRAASAPIQFVRSAVTNPAGTVENVGQGLGSVLGRAGFLARSGAQSVADSAGSASAPVSGLAPTPEGETVPSSFTGDPFGYNKARRDWAGQLNIDPYTSNPVLRPLLDNAAAASFAGSFAINAAIGAVSMGANLVVGFDTDVRDAVWNQPALNLARQNEARCLMSAARQEQEANDLRFRVALLHGSEPFLAKSDFRS